MHYKLAAHILQLIKLSYLLRDFVKFLKEDSNCTILPIIRWCYFSHVRGRIYFSETILFFCNLRSFPLPVSNYIPFIRFCDCHILNSNSWFLFHNSKPSFLMINCRAKTFEGISFSCCRSLSTKFLACRKFSPRVQKPFPAISGSKSTETSCTFLKTVCVLR